MAGEGVGCCNSWRRGAGVRGFLLRARDLPEASLSLRRGNGDTTRHRVTQTATAPSSGDTRPDSGISSRPCPASVVQGVGLYVKKERKKENRQTKRGMGRGQGRHLHEQDFGRTIRDTGELCVYALGALELVWQPKNSSSTSKSREARSARRRGRAARSRLSLALLVVVSLLVVVASLLLGEHSPPFLLPSLPPPYLSSPRLPPALTPPPTYPAFSTLAHPHSSS